MKLGILGLPNVGKSTLFNAITSTRNAQAANYPFCTIEPNAASWPCPTRGWTSWPRFGRPIKDPRHRRVRRHRRPCQGRGARRGPGQQVFGAYRECDALVHVVRCFDDDNIVHVVEDVNQPEPVDPLRDIDAIDLELILADLEVVNHRLARQQKAAKTGNKAAAAEAAWLAELAAHLEAEKPARTLPLTPPTTRRPPPARSWGCFRPSR